MELEKYLILYTENFDITEKYHKANLIYCVKTLLRAISSHWKLSQFESGQLAIWAVWHLAKLMEQLLSAVLKAFKLIQTLLLTLFSSKQYTQAEHDKETHG